MRPEKPVGNIARGIILALIRRQSDPVERQAWIEIARDTGVLTAADANRLLAAERKAA